MIGPLTVLRFFAVLFLIPLTILIIFGYDRFFITSCEYWNGDIQSYHEFVSTLFNLNVLYSVFILLSFLCACAMLNVKETFLNGLVLFLMSIQSISFFRGLFEHIKYSVLAKDSESNVFPELLEKMGEMSHLIFIYPSILSSICGLLLIRYYLKLKHTP